LEALLVSERSYSVMVEMEDGGTKVLSVSGETPGDAFRRAKETAGVRRVGRVSEAGSASNGSGRGSGHGRTTEPARAPVARPVQPVTLDELTNFTIRGPRVVIHARPGGGERPFKDLQAPPERPDRPRRPEPAPARPRTVETAAPVLRNEPVPQPAPEAASAPEYRVMKSRRKDGQPYLLQRGTWRQEAGKRGFHVAWEKDFPSREAAEKHWRWLEQTERDIADLDPQAA
jgi:hypothetical protein